MKTVKSKFKFKGGVHPSVKIEEELKKAERFETKIFFAMSRKMYADAATQCAPLYDIAFEKTDGFRNPLTPQMILEDSRIIKVFRYCMLPVLSQMKLGQLIGLDTTAVFEENIIDRGARFLELKKIAPELCRLVNECLDTQRFLWLQESLSKKELSLAERYAKKWTCSLLANQNSSTAFRNWRKELQETTAVEAIVRAGYSSVQTRRIVTSPNDLLAGQFSRECRVKGRNIQKADLVVRLKGDGRLLLIEAKAIGVRIDAFKRIKECREKFDDWKSRFGGEVECAVVLSGFVPGKEYLSIIREGGLVFWEHDIGALAAYLRKH